MTNSNQTNTAILKLAEAIRAKGKPFSTELREIPNIPFTSFSEVATSIRQGKILLQRFSRNFDNNIFELFATRLEKNLNSFYITCAFIIPIACITLSFMHSWWWLAGIPASFWILGKSKKIYNRVILSSALSSELNFCFLYTMRQVCLTTPDFKNTYYWDKK